METLTLLPNRRLVCDVLAEIGRSYVDTFATRLGHPSSNARLGVGGEAPSHLCIEGAESGHCPEGRLAHTGVGIVETRLNDGDITGVAGYHDCAASLEVLDVGHWSEPIDDVGDEPGQRNRHEGGYHGTDHEGDPSERGDT